MKGQSVSPPLCISVFMSNKGIQKVSLSHSNKKGFELVFHGTKQPSLETELAAWLKSYKEKTFPAPFPFARPEMIGDFTWKTLQALQLIPFGTTKSYLEMARQIGNPHAFRAVGNACRLNPFPLFVPCHRVLKSDGSLGGFAFGLKMKQMLLDFECSQQRQR